MKIGGQQKQQKQFKKAAIKANFALLTTHECPCPTPHAPSWRIHHFEYKTHHFEYKPPHNLPQIPHNHSETQLNESNKRNEFMRNVVRIHTPLPRSAHCRVSKTAECWTAAAQWDFTLFQIGDPPYSIEESSFLH